MIKSRLVLAAAVGMFFGSTAFGQTFLRDGFLDPPDSAKPRTWWHWMSGNITREGITLDMEGFKRIGLGGCQLFDAQLGNIDTDLPKVNYLSPEWIDMVNHAASEAKRLNLELTITACAGWSESGGPWIKPDQSMQKLVWSETNVSGPTKFSADLPKPPDISGPWMNVEHKELPNPPHFYADSAVVAFRLPDAVKPADQDKPKITSNVENFDPGKLSDNNPDTQLQLSPPAAKAKGGGGRAAEKVWIQFQYDQPFTCRAISLFASGGRPTIQLQTADDAGDDANFKTIFKTDSTTSSRGTTPITITIPATTSKNFRLLVTNIDFKKNQTWDLKELALLDEARINHWEDKAGFGLIRDYSNVQSPAIPAEDCIKSGDVIDLTSKMDKNGHLDWKVPAGNWTILRLGHSPTGVTNHPAVPAGIGLEADKMNAEDIAFNFHSVMDPIKAKLGALVGTSLGYMLTDSWEAGLENWTPNFLAEFKKRRGYDPTPYLPALTGRIVESSDVSERFLFDVRRTIADLIADNHYGTLDKLCHENGMGMYAEAPGIGMPVMADELQCKGRVDVPMGEFWTTPPNQMWAQWADTREAAMAAHTYGKKLAAAESFTCAPDALPYQGNPFQLKAEGDLQFCGGLTRMVFHTSAHQPFVDRKPGMTLGPFGQNMGRNQTWWDHGGPEWVHYLTRCQYLLQQGMFVADLCYFYGEDVPRDIPERQKLSAPTPHGYDAGRGFLDPTPPAGFDYDVCNGEVLRGRMKTKDGMIVLPDGMCYRALVLPNTDRMTLADARKVKELVEDGATVIGPRPVSSPSLTDYPRCDGEIKSIANELWGDCDGKTVTEHTAGKGHIIWGKTLDQFFAEHHLIPDFSFKADDANANLQYIHRVAEQTDMYFVSNQKYQPVDAECTFRVTGKIPQLWNAETGEIQQAPVWQSKEDSTEVTLHLKPAESVFVMFHDKAEGADPIVSATVDGKSAAGSLKIGDDGKASIESDSGGEYKLQTASGKTSTATAPEVAKPIDITGSWEVTFPPNWGAPPSVTLDSLASWTKNSDDGVKHFSGTATYHKQIDIPADWIGDNKHVWLDLGDVKLIAEVKLNGKPVETLWRTPFDADITSAAKAGSNDLEIAVTNVWVNRLVGDASLPKDKRFTFAPFSPYKPDSPLLDSGLLGPVTLRQSLVIEAK